MGWSTLKSGLVVPDSTPSGAAGGYLKDNFELIDSKYPKILYCADPGDGEITITTSYTTISTVTLPADTFVNVGDALRVEIVADRTAGSSSWRTTLSLGGQTIGKDNNYTSGANFTILGLLYATAAGSVKGHQIRYSTGGAGLSIEQDAVGLTFSNTIDLTLEGIASSATNGITVKHIIVQRFPSQG